MVVRRHMTRSFLLGTLGGVFSFLTGILAFFIMTIGQASGLTDIDLTINIALAFLAGILGAVGSIVGSKRGGAVLIISAVLALIATSFFGILPCVLLLLGGILAYREREAPEGEFQVAGELTAQERKKEFRNTTIFYITILGFIIAMGSLVLQGTIPFLNPYLQPRAKLTVSIDSFQVSGSSTWTSISVPVRIANYSPRTAHITNWTLTLHFENSTFQFPDKNCTYGATKLEPAQQTEFLFSYDITNNTSIDVNALRSMVFAISHIDDQGTRQQQFEFIRPHS